MLVMSKIETKNFINVQSIINYLEQLEKQIVSQSEIIDSIRSIINQNEQDESDSDIVIETNTFKLYKRISSPFEMLCKFYNLNNKKIIKTILFEHLDNQDVVDFIKNNEFISIVFNVDNIELIANYYENNNYDEIKVNRLVIEADETANLIAISSSVKLYDVADKFVNKMQSFWNFINQISNDVVAIKVKRSEFDYNLLYCYFIHCSFHGVSSSDFISYLDDAKADLFIKTINSVWK